MDLGIGAAVLDWLVAKRLSYSVGFTITDILATVPESDWQIAYDADGEPRPGTAVLAVTGLLLDAIKTLRALPAPG